MNFDSAQFLTLLQWTDSAFPTGAFAHSNGLETYTQAGIVQTPADLARLIAARLEAVATTDLIIVHAAMTAAATGDEAPISALDQLLSASKLVRESREASERIGRRLLASILNLRDDPLLAWYQGEIAAGRCAGHHAVVHGLASAGLGIEARAALITFAYALAVNQTAAALKLIRIGQTQTQAVLAASGAGIVAAVAAALARNLDDFGAFAPGLDIRAMQHEHLFRRLFIS